MYSAYKLTNLNRVNKLYNKRIGLCKCNAMPHYATSTRAYENELAMGYII